MSCYSPEMVKQHLFNSVEYIQQNPHSFFINPEKDFSRVKKISLTQTLLFPLVAASDNVYTELVDFFQEENVPSPSAIIQRRNQLRPFAYEAFFHHFTSKLPAAKTYLGLRLLACDGTRLNLPYNPNDRDTFFKSIRNRKGINQIHMNALYDLMNDVFIDSKLQNIRKMDEKAAFSDFLKEYDSPEKTLFIADRGYASFNIFRTAIANNRLFLIRVKESFAKSLCTKKKRWLTREKEDVRVTVHVGRRNTAELRRLENYHFVARRSRYDYIEPGSDNVDTLKLRVVKFPISDTTYEYIVTNLNYCYSARDIQELYRLRWGIETAFRHLKYAGNMVHIHSLKKEFLYQEIYAKLTLYNFSSVIVSCANETIKKTTKKYEYLVNHSQVLKICIRFLRGTVCDVMKLIGRMTVPRRPSRSFPRNLRRQSADTLAYR